MEPRKVLLTIAGDTNNLSPNARMNRGKKMRLVKEWREKAKLIACNARPAPFEGAVIISFTLRRGRLLDDDNAAGSHALKAICDGLRDAGLIQGDTLEFMRRGEVIQAPDKRAKLFPSVDVCIEESHGNR